MPVAAGFRPSFLSRFLCKIRPYTSTSDLLSQDVPLEDVQYLAGHANPRTTQIYDRRRRPVTRNIVDRISV